MNIKNLGCYQDVSSRALPRQLANTGSPQICAAAASAAGFTYFAMQYGGECFVTNNLAAATQYGTSQSCNMQCSAVSGITCGGPMANDLYEIL
jgi:hypothetical protein